MDENRQRYHCFGCGTGGDVLSFLQERDGLSFRDALHQLARRAGVPIPERNPERAARWEALRKAVRDALDHYQATLRAEEGRRAREYLRKRGIPREEFGEYGFGYAPSARSAALGPNLERKGSPREIQVEAGLARASSSAPGDFFDFFRNRLIIPIFDASGHVAGFAGRSLDGSEPKYINSPDSPIYRKKTVLYGLHRARRAIRRERSAVLLEGYFDCVAAWRAGVPQAVAVCGTSFTPEHARLLKAHAGEVVLCFDADSGGQRAVLRSLPILLRHELRVRVASLGNGRDPDDFIREQGGEAFRRALAGAPGFVPFLTRREGGNDGAERAARFRETLEILASWPSPLEREAWLDEASREAGFAADSAREELARILERQRAESAPVAREPADGDTWRGVDLVDGDPPAPTPAEPALTAAERDLIRWGMERPREVAELLRKVRPGDLLGFVASGILSVMKGAADQGAVTAEELFGGEAAGWNPAEAQMLAVVRTEAVPLNTGQQQPADCLRALFLASADRDRRQAGANLARVQELNQRLDRLRRGKDPFGDQLAGNP